jgi:hypothetical protein
MKAITVTALWPETPYGPLAELTSRLADCLGFARRTVLAADPEHERWRVDRGQVSGYEKMMLEAALAAFLADRRGVCPDEAAALIRTVRERYDTTSALAATLRHPRLALSLGTMLIVFDRFGMADDRERAILRRALDSPYLHCVEHVPFRLLDRRWVQGIAGRDQPPAEPLLRLTAACRTTHPIHMSRADAYAITHAVMYGTDFGDAPVPDALRGDALWQTIDATIAWCVAADDHDLVAELLMAQVYLRRRLSARGVLAWNLSRARWDSFGFLPSPSLRAEDFADLGDDREREQYAFHNMYHTVFVGGLLCVALLDPEVALPEPEPMDPPYRPEPLVAEAVEGAARHVAATFAVDVPTARAVIDRIGWTADDGPLEARLEAWTSFAPSDAIALRAAIDATIIRAAQDYDLPALAGTLRRAAAEDVATSTVAAGLAFLAGQSLADGTIGAGGLTATTDPAATVALANCLLHADRRLAEACA